MIRLGVVLQTVATAALITVVVALLTRTWILAIASSLLLPALLVAQAIVIKRVPRAEGRAFVDSVERSIGAAGKAHAGGWDTGSGKPDDSSGGG